MNFWQPYNLVVSVRLWDPLLRFLSCIRTWTKSCNQIEPKIKQAKRFAKLVDIFAKFFDVFGHVRTCFDTFGCIWIHLDTCGYIRMLSAEKTSSKNFEKFLKFVCPKNSRSFSIFSWGFGRAGGKQTSKSASAFNFVQDTPILKSVRPKIVKKWLVPSLRQSYRHIWRPARA